jgi:flagellar protein FlaG
METIGSKQVLEAGKGVGLDRPFQLPSPPVASARGARPVPDKPATTEVNEKTRAKIEQIAKFMDDYVRSSQRSLSIQVDGNTGRTVVRVISKEDGRTIREIPPEEVLNLAAKMEEMIGLLFDRKV